MAEKVATVNFSVPVGDVPAVYTGRFVNVALEEPAYAPGESIRILVDIEVTREAQWIDIFWHSILRAYSNAGVLLYEDSIYHVAVPGMFDYETYDTSIEPGRQTAGGLSGWLELWCEGSPEVMVATAQFGVPVITNGIEPPEAKKRNLTPWIIGGSLVVLTGIIIIGSTK